MAKEIILKLNEEQAQIVSGACEFYARVRMGQFEEISHQLMVPQKFDDTWCSRRDGAEQALLLARRFIYPELNGRGHSYGVGKFRDADLAFDVYQVLRQHFGDERTPFSEYPLPECTVESIPDVVEEGSKLSAKTLAKRLNGREYTKELTVAEAKEAKEAGLVVVFGYSDDCIEFQGAVSEELGCVCFGKNPSYRDFYISREGFVRANEDDKLLNATDEKLIRVVWCDRDVGAAWSYQTSIPHEKFNIYEDEELFCVGIVFSLSAL